MLGLSSPPHLHSQIKEKWHGLLKDKFYRDIAGQSADPEEGFLFRWLAVGKASLHNLKITVKEGKKITTNVSTLAAHKKSLKK